MPCNDLGTGFLRGYYHEDFLEHLVSREDFLAVVDSANTVIKYAWTKKRNLDNEQLSLPRCYAMGACLLLAVALGIFLVFFVFYDYDPLGFDLAVAAGELGMALTFLILLCGVCRGYKPYRSFDSIVHADLVNLLSRANKQPAFAKRSLYWRIHPRRFWLELVIERPRYHQPNLSNALLLVNNDNSHTHHQLSDSEQEGDPSLTTVERRPSITISRLGEERGGGGDKDVNCFDARSGMASRQQEI